jgi:hypothetical protein
VTMRKIGERSTIGSKAPVVNSAADFQESALGVKGEINDVVFF